MADKRGIDWRDLLRPGAPEYFILVLAALTVACTLPQIILFQYGRDQAIYSMVGRAILEGGAPYKDVWDFKPPGIYFTYALARSVFGQSMHAVRLLESLAYLSLVPAFLILSKRHIGQPRAGLLACALAMLYYVQIDFWHTGQPESFGGILVVWAIVSASYRPMPDAARRQIKQFAGWSASGALYAAAALLKPPLGGGFICSLLVVTIIEWRIVRSSGRRARVILPAAGFTAGAAVVLLACIGYFFVHDALPDLHATLFGFVPHYITIDNASGPFLAVLFETLWKWLFQFEKVSSLAGTIGFLLFFLPPLVHRREGEAWIHILGAIAFQILGVAMQGKLFMYHFGGLLPLTALLSAWGYWKLLRFRGAAWVVAAIVTIAAGYQLTRPLAHQRSSAWYRCEQRTRALLNPAFRDEINDRLHSLGDVNAGANRKAADWIARYAPGDEPIYIWGFEPILYELSGREPASRYIYNVPQRAAWSAETSRTTLMEDLSQSSPSVIVVVHRDRIGGVVGNSRDSRQELDRFVELKELIGSRYRSVIRFEDLELYVRTDIAAPTAGVVPLEE